MLEHIIRFVATYFAKFTTKASDKEPPIETGGSVIGQDRYHPLIDRGSDDSRA
jgi:hypothetical protein